MAYHIHATMKAKRLSVEFVNYFCLKPFFNFWL